MLGSVVIHGSGATPNLDAEGVGIVVVGRDLERVASLAVDRALSAELCLVTRHDQPLIAGAVEVQVASFELELRVPIGHVGALLVLRDESEAGLATHAHLGGIGPRR